MDSGVFVELRFVLLESEVGAEKKVAVCSIVNLEVESAGKQGEFAVRNGVQVVDHLANEVSNSMRLEVPHLSLRGISKKISIY